MLASRSFWISLRQHFPGICSKNLSLSLFTIPSAPITTGVVMVFISHIFWILSFKIIILLIFFKYFKEYNYVGWYCHVSHEAEFIVFCLFITMSIWLAFIVIFVYIVKERVETIALVGFIQVLFSTRCVFTLFVLFILYITYIW